MFPPFHLESKLFFPSASEGPELVLKTGFCIFPRHHNYFPPHRIKNKKEKENENIIRILLCLYYYY